MEGENIYNFTLEVEKEDRIDKLLSNYFIEYSRSTIQKWIASKNVEIDGNICSQKDRVKNNCSISINISLVKYVYKFFKYFFGKCFLFKFLRYVFLP